VCILVFYAVAFGQPIDCMRGDYWSIMWQLKDALRASIRQCNNVRWKKKTNMEGPLGDHIQIVVSYVCSDKHECRYNTNRLVFTSKYNLCLVENFRSSILIRKILIGNIYSRIYRIKYTFRTQNKSRWNVYIKLHIIIWLPIGIFKISIVRHTHTYTRARARACRERERAFCQYIFWFENTYKTSRYAHVAELICRISRWQHDDASRNQWRRPT